jgi:hypothetical protein
MAGKALLTFSILPDLHFFKEQLDLAFCTDLFWRHQLFHSIVNTDNAGLGLCLPEAETEYCQDTASLCLPCAFSDLSSLNHNALDMNQQGSWLSCMSFLSFGCQFL